MMLLIKGRDLLPSKDRGGKGSSAVMLYIYTDHEKKQIE